MAQIHEKRRMPVIIPCDAYDHWLDPRTTEANIVTMLKPYPADQMIAYPVGIRQPAKTWLSRSGNR